MLIYDLEVFKNDVLIGVLNDETGDITQLWGVQEIKQFVKDNLNKIWAAFNNHHYDDILTHGMLTNKLNDEYRVFQCSNDIIKAQDSDTPLFGILAKYDINDYYQTPLLSIDVMGDGAFFSLKQLEGYMGMDIVESVVPFDLDRKLTDEEKREVEKYNRADLYGTLERLRQRKNTIKTKMLLVKEFGLPINYIGKTNAKLTEAILLSQNKGMNTRQRNHFELCDLPVNWEVPEIKKIYSFFIDVLKELELHKWDTTICDKKKLSMTIDILGVEHTYALGGVHGGLKNYICRPEDGKKIIVVDVGLTQWLN